MLPGKSWLSEGFCGAWGLGCTVCAGALALSQSLKPGRNARWKTKWATYQVRSLTRRNGKSYLGQHAHTQAHKRAMQVVRAAQQDAHVHLSKSAHVPSPHLADEAEAWKGMVPQLQAWIDAWAESSTCVSFRKQETISLKKGSLSNGLRKQRRKMLNIMAEVIRKHMRAEIREATSITLALDGKGCRKVVRYRCDTPSPSPPTGWERFRRNCETQRSPVSDCSQQDGLEVDDGMTSRIPHVTDGIIGIVMLSLQSLSETHAGHSKSAART